MMFSRFRKSEPGAQKPAMSAVGSGSPAARATSAAVTPVAAAKTAIAVAPQRNPTEVAAQDKDRKRKERMSELKVELHKRLLENLNLAALETATEGNLKVEIAAITAEALEEMSVVLNKDDRTILNQDLYDEVMGLGPLEPLLKDESINDILVNGPHRIFIERGGKLTLTDITFKDERHLLRIIDKIGSAVGRRVDESNP